MRVKQTVAGASALLAASAVTLAGCATIGQGEQPPDGRTAHSSRPAQDEWTRRAHAAAAYMKAHPVPARPGMFAGIVFAGDAPGSRYWILEVATRDGEWVEAQCGNKADPNCEWREHANLLGAYVYVTSEGCCSTALADHPHDIRVIRYGALRFTGMATP